MPLDLVLDRLYFGNSVQQWFVAFMAGAVALLVFLVARAVISQRLGVIAERTVNWGDDLAVALIRRTTTFFLLALSVLIASRFLLLSPRVAQTVHLAAFIFLLVQAGRWGNTAIDFWVVRYMEQRRAAGEAGTAWTIRALGYLARVFLWALILITALGTFDVNISALVTGLGVGGIAIALAVQNILGDLLAALAIVFDKPFIVGDFVVVDTMAGTVEHIGLKTTRIRSLSGEQIIFSNADLLKSRIRNFKRMAERRALFTVDVTYDTPPQLVAEIPGMIRAIIEAQPNLRFDRSHFTAFADSSLRFETVYHVLAPEYIAFADAQQHINLELLKQFNERGIEFAFPTRTIHTVAGAAPAT
jgi:small-conductance mechanosensitive channel